MTKASPKILFQIPVYKGADKSLIGSQGDSTFYHGKDGLGDAPDAEPVDESLIKPEHAVTALLSLASKHRGSVSHGETRGDFHGWFKCGSNS